VINKGSFTTPTTELRCNHSLAAPERDPLGSMSGLHIQMSGLPHVTVRFFLYLSVSVNVFWAPKKDFHWGTKRMSKSSRTM